MLETHISWVFLTGDVAYKLKKAVELPPGKHVFKTKFGKKMVTQEIDVEAGGSYTLVVDPKKKRLTLK